MKKITESLMAKLDMSGSCWVWLGAKYPAGYGRFRGSKAHRSSWTLLVGDIPAGMCVLHKCDNPPCCNPGHLFLGTSKDNHDDMVSKGRKTSVKGILNGRAKLNADQAEEIRRRHLKGIGPHYRGNSKELCREFGISATSLLDVVNRKTWRESC